MKSILLAFMIAITAVAAQAQTQGVVAVGTFTATTTYQDPGIVGYVAYLDLSKSNFTPVVTPLDVACRSAGDGQVRAIPTRSFAELNHTLLAITANTGYDLPALNSCCVPAGVIIAKGRLVNPGQTGGPTLYFPKAATSATITSGNLPATGVEWAVAGSTNTNNNCTDLYQPGTALIYTDSTGRHPGACPGPKALSIAARGAAGLDKTGRILIIAVVEGTENSSGLKTLDWAYLMMGLGAYSAVNFDGGGSTTFYWTPDDHGLPQSEALATMLKDAKFPSDQHDNWNNLAFTTAVGEPKDPIRFDNQCPDPKNPLTCGRPIYGSLGFTYQP